MATTCYRHPDRETGVACSACERPICPDCMTPTPVGMRCPECSRQRTEVRTAETVRRRATTTGAPVTKALIAACVGIYIAELATGAGGLTADSGRIYTEGALFGPAVANGDWWRLASYGFLHANLLHIGFNMYLLWVLGQMLEPAVGSVRFAAVYVASLLAGALGALIVTPDAATVGASGAVFGLMGFAFLELRQRGIDPFQAGIGWLIVINLALSFFLSGISIGGHIGGLVGGALAALALQQGDRRRMQAVGLAAVVALAVVCAVAGVSVADRGVGA